LRRRLSRGLLLFLTLTLLLTGSFAAQTGQQTKRAAAKKLFDEGVQLYQAGTKESLTEAVQKFTAALPLYHSLAASSNEAETLVYLGFICSRLGEQQRALDYYGQALPLYRAARDRGGEATTLNNIGLVYAISGEQRKALDDYNQALTLFRALGDRDGEATTLNNIGKVNADVGEKQKALDYYAQSLPLRRAVGDRAGEATELTNIGAVYDDLGEKQKALDYYSQALPIFREAGDRRGEAITLGNIGLLYDALGESQKALDYYSQALPVIRLTGDRRGEAVTLGNIGKLYSSLGEPQKALDYFGQALLIRREIGDRGGEAGTLINIGAACSALGDEKKALDYYVQALPITRSIGDRSSEAIALSNVGTSFSTLGDGRRAVDRFNEALPIFRAVGDHGGAALTLFNIARVERDRGNLKAALDSIESALTLIESLRTKITNQELRSSYFATVQDYYQFYIDLLMRLHKLRPAAGYDGRALQASERARARSLLETLAEAGADIRQGVAPQLVERERSLQRQLNVKAEEQIRLLSGEHTEAEASALAAEVAALTSRFQQVETEIRQTSPRYAALTQPQPLSLKDIQTQVLDADTVLLEYSLGADRSYLWAVTPTAINSFELAGREEIEAKARSFYESISTPPALKSNGAAERGLSGDLRRQSDAQSGQVAAQLSRLLLAPVAAALGKKRLLVVADGALLYIPFAALPEPSNGESSAAAAPLIVNHEVVNLPSASTLAVLRSETAERKAATKLLAVLADPVFERTDERFKAGAGRTSAPGGASASPADETRGLLLVKSARESGVAAADLRIPRLTATRREADEITQLAPPSARREVLDFAASRASATDPELGDYRYVHFATHGFLDSLHPELSGLLLSMLDERGEPQDGFLRAHEVFNLKLSADVVVLSACQTGLGQEVKGEGLVGLTRGFMYAGSARVVVSLWSVNDAATAELMTRFYREMLTDKLRPAQALQRAQVSLLSDKRFGAPFYWAAFTLQGEWR
jgi:CHAT domain-containing protein/Flp pilus assembly protein TadD